MKIKLDKKTLYGIIGGCVLLLGLLVMFLLPSNDKSKTNQRITVVEQDVRLKCDIVVDAKLGGEDRTATFNLSVNQDEVIRDYTMSESITVEKIFSIENPKEGEMMPYAPNLPVTNRYYVMMMVGDIVKIETLDKEGVPLEEKYVISNARSEYRIIPVSMLAEYDSVHLEHKYVKDVKIMPRSEFMSKIKNVKEIDSLINW